MSEFEGDGWAEFNVEDLDDLELAFLRNAVHAGAGAVRLNAYVYIDIGEPPERE